MSSTPTDSPTGGIAIKIDRRGIRQALKRLQRPDELQACVLASSPLVTAYADKCDVSIGEAVRAILLRAIDTLKPAGAVTVAGTHFADKAWRHHLILHEQYVNVMPPKQLFQKFSIVEGTYFQEQAHALDRLCVILADWNRRPHDILAEWLPVSNGAKPQAASVELSMLNHLHEELTQEQALRAALAMTRAVVDHGSLDSAKTVAENALQRSRALGHDQLANLLSIELAAIEGRAANYPAAEALFLNAIDNALSVGDAKARAAALAGLGISWMWQGHVRQARTCLEDSLGLYEAMDAKAQTSAMLGFIGWLDAHQGKFADATAHSQAGLKLIERDQNAESRPLLLLTLGMVSVFQGAFAEAERHLSGALSSAKGLNRLDGVAGANSCLAQLEVERGNVGCAERYAHEAIAVSQTIGHWESITAAQLVLAQAHFVTGDSVSAKCAVATVLDVARAKCCPWFECAAHILKGVIEAQAGNRQAGHVSLQHALSLARMLDSALYESKARAFDI